MFVEALAALERNDRKTVEAVLSSQIAQFYMAWESEKTPQEVVKWCESIRKRASESPLFNRIVNPPEIAEDDVDDEDD